MKERYLSCRIHNYLYFVYIYIYCCFLFFSKRTIKNGNKMEERSINNRSAKRATFFEKRFRFSSREQFERNLSWARFIQDKIAGVTSTLPRVYNVGTVTGAKLLYSEVLWSCPRPEIVAVRVEKTLRGSFIRELNGVQECRLEAFDVDTKMAPLAERGGRERDIENLWGRSSRKLMRAACVGGHVLKASKVLPLFLFLSSVSFIRSRPSPSSVIEESSMKVAAYAIRPWFKCLQRRDKNHGGRPVENF